jgi:hypothetical protein
MDQHSLRLPIRTDRVRTIPRSFSWIDRDLLHRGFLQRLGRDSSLLYFFLSLVAGPEGTSYWSYERISKILHISVDELIDATRDLVASDLLAFEFPRFQVLSIPLVCAEKEIPRNS